MGLFADFIFLILFFIFLIGWFIAWLAFHVVAGGLIHILLVIAVIALILHFVRGRRRV